MRSNKLNVFLIILILSSCLSVYGSYSFSDVTPQGRNDKYAEFVSMSQRKCVFDYDILLKGDNGNEVLIITGVNYQYDLNTLAQEEGKYLYRVQVTLNSAGDYTIIITITDNGLPSEKLISATCTSPPSFVTLKKFSDYLGFSYSSVVSAADPFYFFQIPEFIKLQAPPLIGSFQASTDSYESIRVEAMTSNIYKVTLVLSPTKLWSDILNNVSITVVYPNAPGYLTPLPPFASFIDSAANNIIAANNILLADNSNVYTSCLYSRFEITKSGNEKPFLMYIPWSPIQIPFYPFLLSQNNTDPNLIQETYFTSISFQDTFTSDTFSFRYLENNLFTNVPKTVNHLSNIVPFSRISDSSNYNISSGVATSSFITTMGPNFDYSIDGENYSPMGSTAPLYLAEGNMNSFTIELCAFVSPHWSSFKINYYDKLSQGLSHTFTNLPGPIDSLPPILKQIELSTIRNYLIIQMNISDNLSGFKFLNTDLWSSKNLFRGNFKDGLYEIVIDLNQYILSSFQSFIPYDVVSNSKTTFLTDYLTIKLDIWPNMNIEASNITNVRFEHSELDVSNQAKNNILYISYPFEFKDIKPQIYNINPLTNLYYYIRPGEYDEAIGAFKFNITVPKNYISGQYSYSLSLSQGQYLDTFQLQKLFGSQAGFTVKSTLGDIMGPVIQILSLTPSKSVDIETSMAYTNITWRFNVIDSINGFKNGTIKIQSGLDLVDYTFFISPKNGLVSGDKYSGIYEITIPVNSKCKSQEFYMRYAYLYDENDFISFYDKFYNYPFQTPFLTTVDMKTFSITTNCIYAQQENVAPSLISFDFYPKYIDTTYSGVLNELNPRLVTFDFVTSDESGILLASLPKIYLHQMSSSPIFQEAVLVSSNETFASYQCKFEIPYGFGFPNGIKVSLFGIVDNQSNFKGYSTDKLPVNEIQVSPVLNLNISIFSTSGLSIHGGDLILFGKQFGGLDTVIFQDKDFNIIRKLTPKRSTVTLIELEGIPSFDMEYIYISVERAPLVSNLYKLDLKDYTPPPDSSSSSSENNNLSSDSNIPNNSPQPCLNQCSDHGDCTSNGCVCRSPYIGLDCSSQVIIVPPKINNTTPESNFTIPTIDNNNVLYAIISVVALNELDNNNNVLNRYSFDKWIVSNNTQSRYQQYTNSTGYIYSASLKNNNDQSITNIGVSIDYFNINEAINITFANQQLQMNPHSLKYSINITNYSFKSSLNSLQLVLSASIESDHNNDECSSKQIGDVVDSESEFIKMQIDKNSLYGRFIKRGVIDGRVKYVTNTLLDSEYNAIETTSKSQTFIGINIPFYSRLAQLDPDFSILVDNRPASDNDNAVCGARKSKLTGAQIAGIAIGCAAFVAIIVTSTVYYFYKKRQTNKFNADIKNKMKNLN
ncbi:hypothetical protein CYY_001927 [Polysphondylium violaceum]|uniref:EGF-like domain-containing protein n=1 Tax=Polysphondylium violaceum TaxID=133409 RepID=A0A8J4V3D2_9MYCE|nr:hypothetical protein CYY_001927 [Polysphondylium violaceum]